MHVPVTRLALGDVVRHDEKSWEVIKTSGGVIHLARGHGRTAERADLSLEPDALVLRVRKSKRKKK